MCEYWCPLDAHHGHRPVPNVSFTVDRSVKLACANTRTLLVCATHLLPLANSVAFGGSKQSRILGLAIGDRIERPLQPVIVRRIN